MAELFFAWLVGLVQGFLLRAVMEWKVKEVENE